MNQSNSFQSLQISNDQSIYFNKPNYQLINEENMKIIDKIEEKSIKMNSLLDLSFYDQNHLIITDNLCHQVFKIDLNGKFQQFIGKSTKGNSIGYFNEPQGIFVSKDDRIFIVDSDNHRIQIFNGQTGDFQSTFGSKGSENAQFDWPISISIDGNDRIFISDHFNHRIEIFDSTNQWISQIKSNNQSNEDYIEFPSGIIHNLEDYLFICDSNNIIVCFDRNNQFTFNFGSFGSENGQFGNGNPQFISIDRWDQLMISDYENNRISIHNSDGSFLSNIPINHPIAISSNKYNGMIGVISKEIILIEIDQ